MNLDELKRLPPGELRKIKNRNRSLFHVFTIVNLSMFYYSLFTENWILLFITFGFFVSTLALYDNYKASSDLAGES